MAHTVIIFNVFMYFLQAANSSVLDTLAPVRALGVSERTTEEKTKEQKSLLLPSSPQTDIC